jgi:tRNA(His) 5'-end guanylyltransferase
MEKDSLGDRMKADYENRTRFLLPRRTYTIIRVDGKSFHTYARDCARPFDASLMEDMDRTAAMLCEEISGAQLAFVQSDEVSVLLTDFENPQTEAWFDGNLQKLASISASVATAHFNVFRRRRSLTDSKDGEDADFVEKFAYFDSRAFTIPDPIEVENYFIWRQKDATRNSISMSAQAHFSHSRLQGVSTDEMQELLFQEKGINWNDMPTGFKRGRCIVRCVTTEDLQYRDKRTGELRSVSGVERRVWQVSDPPVFTQDREWLRLRIPRLPE